MASMKTFDFPQVIFEQIMAYAAPLEKCSIGDCKYVANTSCEWCGDKCCNTCIGSGAAKYGCIICETCNEERGVALCDCCCSTSTQNQCNNCGDSCCEECGQWGDLDGTFQWNCDACSAVESDEESE